MTTSAAIRYRKPVLVHLPDRVFLPVPPYLSAFTTEVMPAEGDSSDTLGLTAGVLSFPFSTAGLAAAANFFGCTAFQTRPDDAVTAPRSRDAFAITPRRG
jgi:hypothetical protein